MPPAARTALRVIALLGCALLAILTVPDHSPTLLWKWPRPALLQLMLALPAVWVLVASIANPEGRAGLGAAPLAAVALMIVASIVAAFAGPYPGFSTEMLALGVGPLLLLLAVGRASADTDGDADLAIARTIGGGLAALCALSLVWWLAADSLGNWLRADPDGPGLARYLETRNERPLGHSNYTAGVAVLALGWSGGLACLAAVRERKLWLAAAAVAFATVFSSGSRGGWIGVAALAAIGAWLWLVRRGTSRRHVLLGVTIVAFATIALAVAHPRTRVVIKQLRETGTLNTGDIQRLSMMQAAVRMAADRPLLGHGPGATPLAYPAHRAALTGGVETALQLHNTPLQILADTGCVCLAAALVLTALVALRLRRESREPRVTVAGCASIAFLGYAAFSITDFQLDVPVIAAALAATAALALRKADGVAIPPVATMIAVVVWLFLAVWTQRGPLAERARYSAAIDALERGDFAGFRSRVIAGEGAVPPSNAILNATALILADPRAYGVDAPPEPATAIDLLRASLARDPDQEIAHFNLGWLLLQSDPATAEKHFRDAARLVPDKGGVYLGLASALLAQGKPDVAGVAVAAEMVNDPAFCASPMWNLPAFAPARGSMLKVAAMQLESIAPGDDRARRVASTFLWLSGDESQPTPADGLTREMFSPPLESATGVRRQRTAYPLVMRNADMPAPVDLQTVIEDPATRRKLASLFPPKGWLTGPQLRMLLGSDAE